jgi:hypothetical protein
MRVARWVGVAALLVGVLLLALDRIGVYIAERAAADTLESSQHLASRPSVHIDGFPFLTQLASGKYDRITVTADEVPIGQATQPLLISRLTVVLHDLTVSRSFHDFHADTASARAEIPLAELGRTLGVRLSYAGNGRIRATKTVTVAGESLRATVTTRPLLTGGALTFADTSVADLGAIGSAVADSLARIFAIAIPLQGVPFHVHVQSLEVTAGGVTLGLAGRDLSYST